MANIDRRRTLYRPERHVGPAPMLSGTDERKTMDVWVLTSRIVTFWAPGFILSACGMRDKAVQQAWREKVTLCFIIAVLCAIVAFLTLALPQTLCPASEGNSRADISWNSSRRPDRVGIYGYAYGSDGAGPVRNVDWERLPHGSDITYFFKHSPTPPPCNSPSIRKYAAVTFDHCADGIEKLDGQCSQAVDTRGIADLAIISSIMVLCSICRHISEPIADRFLAIKWIMPFVN
jgi:chitin synthase